MADRQLPCLAAAQSHCSYKGREMDLQQGISAVWTAVTDVNQTGLHSQRSATLLIIID